MSDSRASQGAFEYTFSSLSREPNIRLMTVYPRSVPREPGSGAHEMNIADLLVSICTPDGFSTTENIGKFGSKPIGDVERLMLRFNGKGSIF